MGRSTQLRTRITAHLIITAFFFLLRVGEYTRSNEKRRTIPLRKKDIRLWRNGTIIPNSAPLTTLLTADAVTMCLENQKNGHKNAILHHTSSGDALLNPVTSVAILIHAMEHLSPDTPLGSFQDPTQRVHQITASEIRSAIHIGATNDRLTASGYTMARIGSHSLRSGGAMHLKLAGYDNDIIQKLGRWSSNTALYPNPNRSTHRRCGPTHGSTVTPIPHCRVTVKQTNYPNLTHICRDHHTSLGRGLSLPSVQEAAGMGQTTHRRDTHGKQGPAATEPGAPAMAVPDHCIASGPPLRK
jgi:hypothetical protein